MTEAGPCVILYFVPYKTATDRRRRGIQMRLTAKGEQKQGPREGRSREEGADEKAIVIIGSSPAARQLGRCVGQRNALWGSFLFGWLMGGTRVGAANIALSYSFFPQLSWDRIL